MAESIALRDSATQEHSLAAILAAGDRCHPLALGPTVNFLDVLRQLDFEDILWAGERVPRLRRSRRKGIQITV